jgi:hypothetical protein
MRTERDLSTAGEQSKQVKDEKEKATKKNPYNVAFFIFMFLCPFSHSVFAFLHFLVYFFFAGLCILLYFFAANLNIFLLSLFAQKSIFFRLKS